MQKGFIGRPKSMSETITVLGRPVFNPMPHLIYSALALAMNFLNSLFSELSSTEKQNILEKVSLEVGQNIFCNKVRLNIL